MRHRSSWLRVLLLSVAFIGSMALLSSCGDDDEPKSTVVDYYVQVEEEFLVNGLEDHTDRYYSPVDMMKEVIRTAYPEPNATGDDEAVITACDELYQRYLGMYTGKAEHLTCLMHVIRATKRGTIVKQSEILKTYTFDINPTEEDLDN